MKSVSSNHKDLGDVERLVPVKDFDNVEQYDDLYGDCLQRKIVFGGVPTRLLEQSSTWYSHPVFWVRVRMKCSSKVSSRIGLKISTLGLTMNTAMIFFSFALPFSETIQWR